jgi:hypothetical protein
MRTFVARAFALLLLVAATALHAQVPNLINYQGRVAVGGVNYAGPTGQFKFALVNTAGSISYWSNDGTSQLGGPPFASITLPVTNGLYSVLLGDTTVTNMTAIPYNVFGNTDVRLRVWFNDGTHGFQLLTPDQRIGAVGYAMTAAGVQSGGITSAMIANGAVGSAQIANGAVGTAQLAAGALSAPVTVTGTTQAAAANTAYTTTAATDTNFTLPTTANVGDVIQITAEGAGGWTAGQAWVKQNGAPLATWYAVASSSDGTHLVAVTVPNTYTGYVQTGTIYTSADSGVTWTPQTNGLPTSATWSSVASSADGSHLVACGSGTGIYTSTDYGGHWTPQNNGLPLASGTVWTSVASSASGVNLVAIANIGPQPGVYYSSNGGGLWNKSGTSAVYWGTVASDSTGQYLVASVPGSGNGQIWTSNTYGSTWAQQTGGLPSPVQWNSVASSSDGSHLVAVGYTVGGGPDYICTSTDFGANWTPQQPAAQPWSSVASSSDGTHLVVGPDGRYPYLSPDSGVTWVQQNTPDATWTVASSADGQHLVASDNAYIYTYAALGGASGTTATLQYVGNGQWTSVAQQLPSNVTLGGTTTVTGILNLSATISDTTGVLSIGGSPFLQAYGFENSFVGQSAGNFTMSGADNTAIGNSALTLNVTGSENTATGAFALYSNTSGSNNTATGFAALESTTSGVNNTAIGSEALLSNTTGSYNVAVGYNALEHSQSASYNVAIGPNAMLNETGIASVAGENVAIGDASLWNNNGGIQNTAVGAGTLQGNVTSNGNVAVGYHALNQSTGANNIAVGPGAGQNVTSGSNNIEIGSAGGNSGDNNTIRIGQITGANASTQTTTVIAGIVQSGVTGVPVYIDPNGHLGYNGSSARFKQNIADMERQSDVIIRLRPVSFQYKPEIDPEGRRCFGLIAEEVEKVDEALIARDAEGKAKTVRYDAVNAMLLNEFLKEHKRVAEFKAAQDKTIAKLKAENAAMKRQLDGQKSELAALKAREQERDVKLAAIEEMLCTGPQPGVRSAVFNNSK